MQAYGKLCTEYYDLDKPNPPQDALAFYLHYAQIDGVDASPDMFAACLRKCQAKGLSPQIC